MSKEKATITVVLSGALAILMQLAIYGMILYVAGSVITSGLKSYNKECNVTYDIESVVNGNWFCKAKSDG